MYQHDIGVKCNYGRGGHGSPNSKQNNSRLLVTWTKMAHQLHHDNSCWYDTTVGAHNLFHHRLACVVYHFAIDCFYIPRNIPDAIQTQFTTTCPRCRLQLSRDYNDTQHIATHLLFLPLPRPFLAGGVIILTSISDVNCWVFRFSILARKTSPALIVRNAGIRIFQLWLSSMRDLLSSQQPTRSNTWYIFILTWARSPCGTWVKLYKAQWFSPVTDQSPYDMMGLASHDLDIQIWYFDHLGFIILQPRIIV